MIVWSFGPLKTNNIGKFRKSPARFDPVLASPMPAYQNADWHSICCLAALLTESWRQLRGSRCNELEGVDEVERQKDPTSQDLGSNQHQNHVEVSIHIKMNE